MIRGQSAPRWGNLRLNIVERLIQVDENVEERLEPDEHQGRELLVVVAKGLVGPGN
jgi:hypothetical protein